MKYTNIITLSDFKHNVVQFDFKNQKKEIDNLISSVESDKTMLLKKYTTYIIPLLVLIILSFLVKDIPETKKIVSIMTGFIFIIIMITVGASFFNNSHTDISKVKLTRKYRKKANEIFEILFEQKIESIKTREDRLNIEIDSILEKYEVSCNNKSNLKKELAKLNDFH